MSEVPLHSTNVKGKRGAQVQRSYWGYFPSLRGPRYRGTSLIRKRTPLGPCSRTMPRSLWSPRGVEVSCKRCAPVGFCIDVLRAGAVGGSQGGVCCFTIKRWSALLYHAEVDCAGSGMSCFTIKSQSPLHSSIFQKSRPPPRALPP